MSKEQVEFKMLFLFPGSEGKRIQVNVGEDGVFIVTMYMAWAFLTPNVLLTILLR